MPLGIISARSKAFRPFVNSAQTRRFLASILAILTKLIWPHLWMCQWQMLCYFRMRNGDIVALRALVFLDTSAMLKIC